MGDREPSVQPRLVVLDREWPPVYLPQDVPEWQLRARDQLLLDSGRTPRQGDLLLVRHQGRGCLVRFPVPVDCEVVGVITSLMRLRP